MSQHLYDKHGQFDFLEQPLKGATRIVRSVRLQRQLHSSLISSLPPRPLCRRRCHRPSHPLRLCPPPSSVPCQDTSTRAARGCATGKAP